MNEHKLIFEKIRYKNFMSVGNNSIEIVLNKSPSTIITGKNGNGKSVLIEALCFVLYGKSYRGINLPNLVNTVNQKDCLVEVELISSGKKYLVRRSIKPNFFEIYENGNKIDDASAIKDQQKYFESFILKIPYKSFVQIVIAGTASYIPFMKLSGPARREIVENFLDISVYGIMHRILKGRIQEWKTKRKNIEYDISKLESNISYLSSSISLLEKTSEKFLDPIKEEKEKLKILLKDKLKEFEDNKILYDQKELEVSREKIRQIEEDKNILIDKRRGLLSNISTVESTLKKFDHLESCPYCEQKISHDHVDSIQNNSKKELDSLLHDLKELDFENKNSHYQDELKREFSKISMYEELEKKLSILKKEAIEYNKKIEELSVKIGSYITDNSSSISVEKEKLLELEKNLGVLKDEEKKLSNMKPIFEHMNMMLKDDGIKSSIIKHYVPLMNKYTNYFLSKLDFNLQFEIDESFKESLKTRYRNEYNYSNFSEGERQRLDIAIMMMWIEVSKIKNSVNTNLLILDETFDSSLDSDGVDALISILEFLGNSGKNVIVISHNNMIPEKFFSHIEIEKINGFSQIKKISALQRP